MILNGKFSTEIPDDFIGVLCTGAATAQVLRQHLPLAEHLEAGSLDLVRVVLEVHVPEHHHAGEQ